MIVDRVVVSDDHGRVSIWRTLETTTSDELNRACDSCFIREREFAGIGETRGKRLSNLSDSVREGLALARPALLG